MILCVIALVVSLLVFATLFVAFLFVGSSNLPLCDGCDLPMPDGFYACENTFCYCRDCAREIGLDPWFQKELENE